MSGQLRRAGGPRCRPSLWVARAATVAALALGVATTASAQAIVQGALHRPGLDLSGPWRVVIDPLKVGDIVVPRMDVATRAQFGRQAYAADSRLIEFSFSDAQVLEVPGSWNVQRPELFLYDGLVWFQREFEADPEPGRRAQLYFAAANHHARVWLNGVMVGEHRGGYTPFGFDVTATIRRGQNSLLVAVDGGLGATTLPPAYIDWWNYGGLVRDVRLVSLPERHVREFGVRLADAGRGAVEGWVQASVAEAGQPVSIRLGGDTHEARTDAAGRAAFAFTTTLPLWSPESPVLHDVEVRYADDVVHDRVGLRTIATDGTRLLLNGRPLRLRGVNFHDERIGVGGVTTRPEQAEELLRHAKALNANFVRLAHYLHGEHTLREADRLGLLVWAEVPVFWDTAWTNADTRALALSMLETMIGRDRNRASVIIWSITNEPRSAQGRDEFLEALIARARALDDSRLVSASLTVSNEAGVLPAAVGVVRRLVHDARLSPEDRAAVDTAVSAASARARIPEADLRDPSRARGPVEIRFSDPLTPRLDVVGITAYFGWYYSHYIAEALGLREALVRRAMLDLVPDLRITTDGQRPVIVNEFGADATPGRRSAGSELWSEDLQAEIYRRELAMLERSPGVVGMAAWALVDMRSPRRTQPGLQDFYNRKGVLGPDGRRKLAFDVLAEHYARLGRPDADPPR